MRLRPTRLLFLVGLIGPFALLAAWLLPTLRTGAGHDGAFTGLGVVLLGMGLAGLGVAMRWIWAIATEGQGEPPAWRYRHRD
jgi:hypothetical protein